jgi:hypothetical protein
MADIDNERTPCSQQAERGDELTDDDLEQVAGGGRNTGTSSVGDVNSGGNTGN